MPPDLSRCSAANLNDDGGARALASGRTLISAGWWEGAGPRCPAPWLLPGVRGGVGELGQLGGDVVGDGGFAGLAVVERAPVGGLGGHRGLPGRGGWNAACLSAVWVGSRRDGGGSGVIRAGGIA